MPAAVRRAALALLLLPALACAGSGSDRVVGSAREDVPSAGELQDAQRRWRAAGLRDYDMDLAITCFCTPEFTRPVTVHVRDGVAARVTPREPGAVRPAAEYPTVDTLLVRAVAEQSGGGHVRGTFDAERGYPTFVEIGTLANDAGIGYTITGLRRAP